MASRKEMMAMRILLGELAELIDLDSDDDDIDEMLFDPVVVNDDDDWL